MSFSRRDFFRYSFVMGASVALSACGRPVEHGLVSQFQMPEYRLPAQPRYWATSCGECRGGCGLSVKTVENRAIKVEGIPEHPVSKGKACMAAQSALQDIYHPDRLDRVLKAGKPAEWPAAIKDLSRQLAKENDQPLFIVRRLQGTQGGLIAELARRTSGKIWLLDVPGALTERRVIKALTGQARLPFYKLEEADYAVTFGGDFFEQYPLRYEWAYGEFRQGRSSERRRMGRGTLIAVSSRMSRSCASADRWLPVRPGTEGWVAVAVGNLLAEAGKGGGSWPAWARSITLEQAAAASGLDPELIQRLANRLANARSPLVIAGRSLGENGAASLYAVHALNMMLRGTIDTYEPDLLIPPATAAAGAGETPVPAATPGGPAPAATPTPGATPAAGETPAPTATPTPGASPSPGAVPTPGASPTPAAIPPGEEATAVAPVTMPGVENLLVTTEEALAHLSSGNCGSVYVIDADPAYVLPAKSGFAEALKKARKRYAFVLMQNATSQLCDWTLPTNSWLESWGDQRISSPDGEIYNLRQPVVRPVRQFEQSRPLLDVVLQAMTEGGAQGIAATGGRALVQGNLPRDRWQSIVIRGGIWEPVSDEWEGYKRRMISPPPAARNPGNPPAGYSPWDALEPLAVASWPTEAPKAEMVLVPFESRLGADGSLANRSWHQELPDPMTTVVWDTWIELNPKVCEKLHVKRFDVVRVSSLADPGLSIEAPCFPNPGLHPEAVAIPVGGGHEHYGDYAKAGRNPFSIVNPAFQQGTGEIAWTATRVKVEKTGGYQFMATHDSRVFDLPRHILPD
ncbi:MAG: molybdopterin-dependent oxidoreductase [Armatimonadetes bacterium]|nr:molybdopterin-dependent oxidoreductase [Armatimonadota bacterium]